MLKDLLKQYISAVLPVIIFMHFILSCSSTKYVPEEKCLLAKNIVKSDNAKITMSQCSPYLQQKPNSKWFSLFKIPLGLYNLSGIDSTRWYNKMFRNLGEAPIIYDSIKTVRTIDGLTKFLNSMGYLDAKITSSTTFKKHKAFNEFHIISGGLYHIDSVRYIIEDEAIQNLLKENGLGHKGLERGMEFTTVNLDNERKRISQILTDNGYFKFNKDFIHFEVDTLGKNSQVDVTLKLSKFRSSVNSPESSHKQYYIRNIKYLGGNGEKIPLKNKVLMNNTRLFRDSLFNSSELQQTYSNFAALQAIKYTNIHFDEVADTNLLDCTIQVDTYKPNVIYVQPEGTNTSGDLGAALSVKYENNNIFHGSECFSVQLRGAFEAIKGLEGYQNQNYSEYNIETKLQFPRIVAPFHINTNIIKKKYSLQSELSFSYNMQNRPEFHRRVLTSAWRYYGKDYARKSVVRWDVINLDYVYMPWISSTFRNEYLDNVSNRNAILKYNYEDLFILKSGVGYLYSNHKNAFKGNIEIGGNFLHFLSSIFKTHKNSDGQYTLFNIAYAQYVKADFDYTHLSMIDAKNSFAFHLGVGVAYPYGNSYILPFEKRYFSGGANSVRGWNVRELGPGKYRGSNGKIDFINQTGDIKLDLNMELRTYLFWKFNGAAFIDMGNIWTIKNYKDQPGGQFSFLDFYKQIAVSYGLGLRLNFDYFIIRLDAGMKAINPAYNSAKEHYPVVRPNLKRDLAVHFAVGLPF